MNSTDRAIIAMRERATTIESERARIGGALLVIRDLGGIDACRAICAAEIERLTLTANDNGDWVG